MNDKPVTLVGVACPLKAIPHDVRLKIYDTLLRGQNLATDMLLHGNLVMPNGKVYNRDTNQYQNSYDNLAATCTFIYVEMYPLKGKQLYTITYFKLNAFFGGPLTRFGGKYFHMADFEAFKHIELLQLEIDITRNVKGPHIEATMKNISPIVWTMPKLKRLIVNIRFTAFPTIEDFALLMYYLSGLRAPLYNIACQATEVLTGTAPHWAYFNNLLAWTGAVDGTDYTDYGWDIENERGWRGGFPPDADEEFDWML